MNVVLILATVFLFVFVSSPAAAQTQPAQPQMPPPPPATQAPPTLAPPTAKAKSSQHCRDAVSGKFVTAAYAKKNPTTTVCEKSK